MLAYIPYMDPMGKPFEIFELAYHNSFFRHATH